MLSTRYFCQTLMTVEFSRDYFEKFHENSSSGRRVVSCGQTDRQTDRHGKVDSRFSKFCERPSKLLCFCVQ